MHGNGQSRKEGTGVQQVGIAIVPTHPVRSVDLKVGERFQEGDKWLTVTALRPVDYRFPNRYSVVTDDGARELGQNKIVRVRADLAPAEIPQIERTVNGHYHIVNDPQTGQANLHTSIAAAEKILQKHGITKYRLPDGALVGGSERDTATRITTLSDALDVATGLTPTQYIRWDRPGMQSGDALSPSRRWEEGEPTDTTLPGISVINPREDFDLGSLLSSYAGVPYVVEGEVIGSGQDQGELILKDARVARELGAKPSSFERPVKAWDDKQPWQMTKAEYLAAANRRLGGPFLPPGSGWGTETDFKMQASIAHRNFVEAAIAEGKSVPGAVMAEYPDLNTNGPAATVTPSTREVVVDKPPPGGWTEADKVPPAPTYTVDDGEPQPWKDAWKTAVERSEAEPTRDVAMVPVGKRPDQPIAVFRAGKRIPHEARPDALAVAIYPTREAGKRLWGVTQIDNQEGRGSGRIQLGTREEVTAWARKEFTEKWGIPVVKWNTAKNRAVMESPTVTVNATATEPRQRSSIAAAVVVGPRLSLSTREIDTVERSARLSDDIATKLASYKAAERDFRGSRRMIEPRRKVHLD